MIDEAKLRQEAARASRAKSLLEDELLKEAFASLEASYIAAWRTSAPLDSSAREKLFLAVNVIGKVRDHLTKVLTDGKLAEKELQRLTEDAERKKRFRII